MSSALSLIEVLSDAIVTAQTQHAELGLWERPLHGRMSLELAERLEEEIQEAGLCHTKKAKPSLPVGRVIVFGVPFEVVSRPCLKRSTWFLLQIGIS